MTEISGTEKKWLKPVNDEMTHVCKNLPRYLPMAREKEIKLLRFDQHFSDKVLLVGKHKGVKI
jgi:hypothetical protein